MNLRKLLKEEWRLHSRIYRGRNFAYFPALIFLFSLGFSLLLSRAGNVSLEAGSYLFVAFGFFLGTAVGMAGFASRSASRGLISDYTLMVHSYRTLPVSGTKMLGFFVLKELLYYTVFFLFPIGLGAWIGGLNISQLLFMVPAFLFGLLMAFLFTRSTLQFPKLFLPSYFSIGEPVVERSEMDLERSAGGLFKIFFSFAVLSGFYWFLVTGFEFASGFLQSPMLSFSAIVGLMTISIYNWLNKFDEPLSYGHLPLDRADILEAKQKAFVRLSLPFIALFSTVPFLFFSGDLLLAFVTAFTTSTYCLGAVSLTMGLKPNTRIYDGLKYSAMVALILPGLLPLLVSSIAGFSSGQVMLLNGFTGAAGVSLILLSREKIRSEK